MAILQSNGTVYMNDKNNDTIEVIKVQQGEYYNPVGTTPQQIQINVYNPEFNTVDTFYFLSATQGVQYSHIQTDETAMTLLELYMSLILKKDTTPQQFIARVLEQYFISELGYTLLRNVA